MTSLSGKLPSGDGNGLNAIAGDLVQMARGVIPPQMFVCIALVDCRKVTVDADTHEAVATVRVRRIEVIRADDDKGVRIYTTKGERTEYFLPAPEFWGASLPKKTGQPGVYRTVEEGGLGTNHPHWIVYLGDRPGEVADAFEATGKAYPMLPYRANG